MNEEEINQNARLMSDKVETQPTDIKAEKKRVYKNLLAVSFSYLFHFSALNGLTNLQSSLNSHENLGVYTLLATSVAFLLSCLILPAVLCRRMGFKWSLMMCQHFALLFIGANYFPSFYTLIPASIFYGAGLSVLWTIQGSFIVHIASEYNSVCVIERLHPEKVMFKLFGLFMIIFQMNQIVGNIISAVVLNENLFYMFTHHKHHDNSFLNQSFGANSTSMVVCGTFDCPGTISEIVRPDNDKVFWLCVIYSCLILMGILTLLIFMDNITPSKEDLGGFSKLLKETFMMFLSKKLWALLPLVAFLASLNTFITVDFSKSYVACMFGIHNVGLSFILCGISSSLFSFLVSQLTKIANKTLILVAALSSTIGLMVYIYSTPSFTKFVIVYFIPMLFGLFEGVWGTIINTLIGTAFMENQLVAFSNNRFCISIFFNITYFYSSVLCVYKKILIVSSLAVMAIISSIVLEFILRAEAKNKKPQANFVNS